MSGQTILQQPDQHGNDAAFDWGDESSTFGDRLARAREYAGMSQGQLAHRLGVKAITLRNWEADRSEPRANRLQMLSGLLNVSIVWLMTGKGDGVPDRADMDIATEDLSDLLTELRALRIEQNRLAEQAGRIERRLRTLLSQP